MTDGRVYTLEDEIDVLHEDLGRARRRYDDLLRAEREGRVVNDSDHSQSIVRARERLACLERELSKALAAQQAADDAYAADQPVAEDTGKPKTGAGS